MRAELPDTHTGAGRSSTISQITGLTRQQTYHELKKAWQDKIREAYSKLSIPNPPNNSQPNTESLKESMDQLVERIYQFQNNLKTECGNMLKEEKQKHASELDTEKQIYEANMKERDRIFGEATRTLRTEHERELKNLQNQLKEYTQNSPPPQPSAPPAPPPIPELDFCKVRDEKSKMNYVFISVDGEIRLHTFNDNQDTKLYTLKELFNDYAGSSPEAPDFTFYLKDSNEVLTLKIRDEQEKNRLRAWLLQHSHLIKLPFDYTEKYQNLTLHKQQTAADLPAWFHQHYSHLFTTATQAPHRPARRKYTVRVPGL